MDLTSSARKLASRSPSLAKYNADNYAWRLLESTPCDGTPMEIMTNETKANYGQEA